MQRVSALFAIQLSKSVESYKVVCYAGFFFTNPFFLFLTFICPVERGNQAGSSWNEFDYSPRGTRTSVPHLHCRSCNNFGVLVANIRTIGLENKVDQTELPFLSTVSFSDYTIEKIASPKFSQLRLSRSGKPIRVPLRE